MFHKPLNLPYKHNVYDGVAVPNFITPERMQEIKDSHRSRNDDVYIATYQKSGTTWLQYILYQMLDEPQGALSHINDAVPWLEEGTQLQADSLKSPRIFKTHDKWNWVPKSDGVKYIYCYRNPKDLAVSYYHHLQMFSGHYEYEGTFDEYLSDIFLKRNGSENGFYFDHVAEWLEQKDNTNILYVTYEDMVENLEREIKRIAIFLNQSLTDEKLKAITSNSTFSSMQRNNTVNYSWRDGVIKDSKMNFIRKGKVGDWANHLSEKHSKDIEYLVDKHLIPLGAKIRYTL